MAFQGPAKLYWTGSVGSLSRVDGKRFTSVYLAYNDDPLQQANAAIEWARANIADIYSTYSYGNDPADALAVLQRIEPKPLGRNCGWWQFVLHYAEFDVDVDVDPEGNQSDNPLAWDWEFDSSTIVETRYVQTAEYQGGYVSFPHAIGTRIKPMTSAQQIFANPPLVEESNRGRLSFTKNFARGAQNIQALKQYENLVDSAGFTFACRGYVGTYQAGEMRIKEIQLGSGRHRSQDYAKISWILEQAPEQWSPNLGTWVRTWDQIAIDEGTMRLRDAGDDPADDWLLPITRTKKDSSGEDVEWPVTEPVLLDGSGQPAAKDAVPRGARWRHYNTGAFYQIPLLSGVLKQIPPP